MRCNLAEQVSLLIDGELPPTEARAVERHLLDCEECRQVRADFISLRSGISSYVALPLNDLSQRLTSVLSPPASASTQSSWRASWSDRLLGVFDTRQWNRALATVVAALLIVFAIALLLHSKSPRRHERLASGPGDSRQPGTGSTASPSAVPLTGKAESSIPDKPDDRVRGIGGTNSNRPRHEMVADVKGAIEGTGLPRDRAPKTGTRPVATNYVAVETSASEANSFRHIRAADTQTLTAQHVEHSELLLRSFRNLRGGSRAARGDLVYERRRAQQLFYQNVLLRREADSAGDVEVATLLESLEPILLDIANLPERAPDSEVRVIKDRVERQNLVALLQVNATAMIRAFEY
jgi:hypothetical protein